VPQVAEVDVSMRRETSRGSPKADTTYAERRL